MSRKFRRWVERTAGAAATALALYLLGQVFSGTKNYLGARVEPVVAAVSPAVDRYIYGDPAPVAVAPSRPALLQDQLDTGSLQAPVGPPAAKHPKRKSHGVFTRLGLAVDTLLGTEDYRDDRD